MTSSVLEFDFGQLWDFFLDPLLLLGMSLLEKKSNAWLWERTFDYKYDEFDFKIE